MPTMSYTKSILYKKDKILGEFTFFFYLTSPFVHNKDLDCFFSALLKIFNNTPSVYKKPPLGVST